MINIGHYTLIAELFEYPDKGFPKNVAVVQQLLEEAYPESAEVLKPFTEFTSKATIIEMQELYTRSFDVQAVTTLDLGYVLFGDDYKRGELMVNLNREHRDAQNDCGNELPDHLTNMMRLLPKMQDEYIIGELVEKVLAMSLRKMIREFDPNHIKAKDKVYKKHHKTIIERLDDYYTIYQKPLEALYEVLKTDFDFKEEEEKKATSDFLRSINTEIEIEKEETT